MKRDTAVGVSVSSGCGVCGMHIQCSVSVMMVVMMWYSVMLVVVAAEAVTGVTTNSFSDVIGGKYICRGNEIA